MPRGLPPGCPVLLCDRSPWSPLCRCQRPGGPRAPPASAAGAQLEARASVVAGDPALPSAECARAPPRRCPPRRALGPGSGEASVFPTPVARGAQEQPPDAPRRLGGEGLGLGSEGRSAGGRGPGPTGAGTAEAAEAARGLGELSVQHWGRARPGGGRHSRSPGESGSAAGRPLLGHRPPDAREAAPERPPLHRRRGVGKRTHRALGAGKRSPGRWLPTSPRLQSCGLGPAGSQPSHDSLWGLGR